MPARTVALTLLGCFAAAQSTDVGPTGIATCQCVAKPVPTSIPEANCTVDGAVPWWAAGQEYCVVAFGYTGDPLYPGDYGDTCKPHYEPADAGCFNLTTGLEDPVADYCQLPWCYIDPCNCQSAAFKGTNAFRGVTIYYSYMACGEMDYYTTTDMANDPPMDLGCDTTTGATRASAVGPALVASLAGLLAYAAL